jgi:hypothetical protein
MRAIHIICHREGTGLKNLVRSAMEKDVYTSGCWALPADVDPAALIGGWIYLHPQKNAPSEIGGIVGSFSSCEREDTAIVEGTAFTFLAKKEGRGQKWRGADHDRAWTGGLVGASYDHEITSGTTGFTGQKPVART